MSDLVFFLGPAFAMCLVIASIHVYLGMHVLAREVIFVDLALAQLAALGATTAAFFGWHETAYGAHGAAFAFTAVGAAIFAFTRRARKRISQEAIIGIVYAVASAGTVLVLSRAPHGAEEMKSLLVGELLLTTWDGVWKVLATYAVLGLLQIAFARRFIRISWSPDEAEADDHLEWWDLLFYLLFGVVITVSVNVAGVLLVFSFLIVPAVISKLFSGRLWPRLIAGWAVAFVASVLGLGASWFWDLPTGAAVVTAFGALLMLAGLVRVVLPVRA